jgi:hypothetical protein
MRYALAFLALWQFFTPPDFPYRTTVFGGRFDLGSFGIQIYGLLYLLLGLAFVMVCYGVLARSSWWLGLLLLAVPVSIVLCLADWPQARLGIPANAVTLALAAAVFAFPGDRLPAADPGLEALWAKAPHGLRLAMRGEIKLQNWIPFAAEQVFTDDGQMVWAAATSMYGLPVRGADRLVSGEGRMDWKLLEFLPVMQAAGLEITRSAQGRLEGELLLWNSSALPEAIRSDPKFVSAPNAQGQRAWLLYPRWGNPDNKGWRFVDFGVIFEEYREFAGRTLPARIRAGWFFNGTEFTSGGEFFRATITAAEYR